MGLWACTRGNLIHSRKEQDMGGQAPRALAVPLATHGLSSPSCSKALSIDHKQNGMIPALPSTQDYYECQIKSQIKAYKMIHMFPKRFHSKLKLLDLWRKTRSHVYF